MKILIIDDIVENLYVLEALLKGSGYECEMAADGAQALEKIEKNNFGCIISDILMPVMDGFQLCYHVKSDEKLWKIPFIFYTATYTTKKDEEFCLKLGADLFLIKPLDPELLIKQIIDFLVDCENGKIIPKSPIIEDDYAYLKAHNLLLTSKLDHKMEELDETHELFRSIFVSATDAIISADINGKIKYINKSALNLFEYEEDEIIGKHISILSPENKFQEQNEIIARLKTEPAIKSFETLRKTSTGKLIPIEISLANMQDHSRHEIGFTAIIRDITERKKADNMLQESEKHFRGLFNNSISGVALHQIVVNDEGEPIDYIFLMANPGFETHTGLHLADILGKHVTQIIPGIEKTNLIKIYGNVALTGEPTSFGTYFEPLQRYFNISAYQVGHGKFAAIFDDITERKKAEDALKRSEFVLNETQRLTKVGGWEYDVATNQTYLSDEIFNIYGIADKKMFAPEEGVNFYHPDDRTTVMDSFSKAITNAEPYDLEVRFINAHEENMWVRTAGKPIMENGKVVRVIGNLMDVTEKKLAEIKIQNSTAKLKEAESIASLGHWELNLQNNELFWSDEIYKIFEIDPSSFGATYDAFLEVIHPEDREFVNNAYTDSLKNKTNYSIDHRLLFENGRIKFVHEQCKTLYDEHGNPLSSLGTIQDITERKQIEDKIHEKDIQFRKLSSNVPDLIFQFTRRPDGTYCVPIASEGIRNIFGCSPEDVVEDFAPIARVIFPEDTNRVISDIEYSAKNLTYFTCEFRVQIPGRAIQWIFSRSAPEKLADGSITWYGFNADITERKKAEEEIRKFNVELEQLVNERTEEIVQKNIELERMNKLFVGREFRIKELKDKIKELEEGFNQ